MIKHPNGGTSKMKISSEYKKNKLSPDVSSAVMHEDYTLTITFDSCEIKTFDMKPYLKYEVFESLNNFEEFKKFHIEFGTVFWECGEGLSKDTFYIKGEDAETNNFVQKEKINLYLDDLRDCPDGFMIARTIEQAKYYLENFHVEILSLDHDLGMDERENMIPTGYDLVKYICKKGLRADRIYIHTDNSVGRENMYQTLLGSQRRGFIESDIKIYNYSIYRT
jgi:hypothetical protein